MQIIFLAIFFTLGLIIGSFLNVVILRFNTQKSLGGRSACMACQSRLQWYELIPLFSFLALRGRCKTCKTQISMQYPLVELITATLFALLFTKFFDLFAMGNLNFPLVYGYYTVMFSILIVISVYDIKHQIIPDALSLVFGMLAFFGMFLITPLGVSLHIPPLSQFIAGFAVSVPFALLWLISRGTWMGLGDAKLSIGFGFLFGLTTLLSGVMLAFWIGAVVGVILILLKKIAGLKSEIPFAPFLVLGLLIAFFWGVNFFPFIN